MTEKTEKKFNLVSYVEGRIYEQFVKNNSDSAPIEIVDNKVSGWGNVLRWLSEQGTYDNATISFKEGVAVLTVIGFNEKRICYKGYCRAIKNRLMADKESNVAREQEPTKEEFEQHVADVQKASNVERCIIEKAEVVKEEKVA